MPLDLRSNRPRHHGGVWAAGVVSWATVLLIGGCALGTAVTKKTTPREPDVLLAEISPHGNVQAVVEVDGHTCFFYLTGAEGEGFGVRSVWVRNLVEAPASLDVDSIQRGHAPMNPLAYCRSPSTTTPPDAEELEVVWLPEGNGAALFEGQDMLAVIPPWSGYKGFNGYSRDALGQGPLAWEFDSDNVLLGRFEEARAYWKAWQEGDPWESAWQGILDACEAALGPSDSPAAFDDGLWPPLSFVYIASEDAHYLITAGVSLLPQPNVESAIEDYEAHRRIELGVVLPATWDDDAVVRAIAALVRTGSYPWENFTWFGPGHTVDFDAWKNPMYTGAMLVRDHPAVPEVELPDQCGDPVRVLWLIPLSEAERDRAMEEGSDAVLETLPADRWGDA